MVLAGAVSVPAAAQDAADAGHRRLYDRETDCAVFAADGFAADRASWDGPCTHGLASGRGTATYFAKDGRSLTISADFADGAIADGNATIAWSDGAHYAGGTVGGAPDGAGVLVDAKGDRFDGNWIAGRLNGRGTVLWTNGDRYEGDWVDGKAEGHGMQTWADGRKYDGTWRNDQPDGQGTITRKNGATVAATFVDGKMQEPPAPGPSMTAPAVRESAGGTASTAGDILHTFDGKTLVAVDGATIAFASDTHGLVRTSDGPDSVVQKLSFNFVGNGLGTVWDLGDPRQASGVFHQAPNGVVVEYANGDVETLSPAGDGLSMVLRKASGAQLCAAWYPKGHVFSAEERKAAVAAYARRLGVGDSASATTCRTPPATPASDRRPSVSPPSRRHGGHGAVQASLTASPAVVPGAADLDVVAVKDSNVHLIDSGPHDARDATGTTPTADEAITSNCLKVDSDGSYWGFRNHCGYVVQFAYCLLHGEDRMTACDGDGAASPSGSVSANGFSALFADDSLGERGVEHDFRWVGCRGGAGEVAPHLDTADPASGHCERSARTASRDN